MSDLVPKSELADEYVFRFWSKAQRLNLHEIALLAAGLNPHVASLDHWSSYRNASQEGNRRLLSAEDTRTVLLMQAGAHEFMAVTITEWRQIFEDLELPFPSGLHDLAVTPEEVVEVEERAEKTEELSETERITLLKMILGMAIDKYDYDPSAKKNDATGDNYGGIAAALHRLDLSTDSDTIRKYLKEASERFGARRDPP